MKIAYFSVPIKYKPTIRRVCHVFMTKFLADKETYVGIHFLSEAKMRQINLQYCQKDIATDVLSFPIWKNKKTIPSGLVNLGDIFICPTLIKLPDDLEKLVKHGLKHLIGIHHRL